MAANIEVAKMLHPGNDTAIELAKTIHKNCGEVTDDDRCEAAYKLIQCSEKTAIEAGFDPKTMLWIWTFDRCRPQLCIVSHEYLLINDQ